MSKPNGLSQTANRGVNKAAEAVFRNTPRLFGMFLSTWKTEMPDAEAKTRLLEELAAAIKDNSIASELLLLVGANEIQRADNRVMDLEKSEREAANGRAGK